MSYTINFSDTSKDPIIVDQNAIDSSTSLSIIGKGYENYGELINQNFLSLLENFSSNTPPDNPIDGQIWFDSNIQKPNIYVSGTWKQFSNIVLSDDAPDIFQRDGDLWQDSKTGLLYMWHIDNWYNIQGEGTTTIINDSINSFATDEAASANVGRIVNELAQTAQQRAQQAFSSSETFIPNSTQVVTNDGIISGGGTLATDLTLEVQDASTSLRGLVRLADSEFSTNVATPRSALLTNGRSMYDTIGKFLATNWVSKNSVVPLNNWTALAYSEPRDQIVALASTGTDRYMYSSDANNWVVVGGVPANSWRSVTYCDGIDRYVAVSTDGATRAMYMAAHTWQPVTVPLGEWLSVAWSQPLNTLVAVGAGVIMYSTDGGATWAGVTPPEANTWNQVIWTTNRDGSNGKFVAVAGDGNNRVMTSPDGVTWAVRDCPSEQWYSVAWNGERYVAISNGTKFMTSTDGEYWELVNSDFFPAIGWFKLIWNDECNMFMSLSFGNGGMVITSPDGFSWDLRPHGQPATFAIDHVWHSGRGMFVACGTLTPRIMKTKTGADF